MWLRSFYPALLRFKLRGLKLVIMKYYLLLAIIFMFGCQAKKPSPTLPPTTVAKDAVTPANDLLVAPLRDGARNLRNEIASGSFLVYFEQHDCPACARMLPTVTQIANDRQLRLRRVLPQRDEIISFGIGHYPTTIWYVNGREINRWLGEISPQKLATELEQR